MPADSEIQKIIDEHIETLKMQVEQATEKIAQVEEAFNHKLQEAVSWNGVLPEDPDSEVIAAVIAHYNFDESADAQLNGIGPEVDRYTRQLQTEDPQKFEQIQQGVAQNIQIKQASNQLPKNQLTVQTLTKPPLEEGNNEWTLITIPVQYDEDGTPEVPAKIEFDMYLTASVAPPSDNLSDHFNAATHVIRAGQPIEPFVLTHEVTDKSVQNAVTVNGLLYKDGQIAGNINMPPVGLDEAAFGREGGPQQPGTLPGGQGGPSPA